MMQMHQQLVGLGADALVEDHRQANLFAEPDELLVHLHHAGLSRYDMPEYFIAMTIYPLTASGKILKRELVEWARTGHIRPLPVRWTDPPQKNAEEA